MRSACAAKNSKHPQPPYPEASTHAKEDPDIDPLVFPADRASEAWLTAAAIAGDAGRTATYDAALGQAEQALYDEHTTVADLTRRLQLQKDLLLDLPKMFSMEQIRQRLQERALNR